MGINSNLMFPFSGVSGCVNENVDILFYFRIVPCCTAVACGYVRGRVYEGSRARRQVGI